MNRPLHVVGLTGERSNPSARFRVGQFVDPLQELGVNLEWCPAPVSAYPPAVKWQRPFWLPVALAGRVPGLLRSHSADVTLFSREFISTFATLEGLSGKPRVFDVDDAIWLRRGGGYAARLARMMDLVVCGNSYLAEWFAPHSRDIEVLPTAVDTERFVPGDADVESAPAFGWVGSSSNHAFLLAWEDAYARVLQERPDVRLRICSDREPAWRHLPAAQVDYVPWSAEIEVAFIQSLSVGLMPLADSPWARGKCSYKMLLYLSCGVPAVVSPVGMNNDVLAAAAVGRAAGTMGEWAGGILDLLADEKARQTMSASARRLVRERYSLEVLSRQWATSLRRIADKS